MKNKEEYTISCNKKQMLLIAKSLEMYSRMKCGQIETSFLPPIQEKIFEIIHSKDENFREKRKLVEDSLRKVKLTLWEDLTDNSHYGIGYNNEADLGYEMYKEILHQIEKEDQERCEIEGEKYQWNVHSSKPCLKLTDEPLIEIEKK